MKLILALALGATAQFATPALRGGARRLEALELLGAEESAKVDAEQEAARAAALAEAMAQLKEAQDMMAKAEALKAAALVQKLQAELKEESALLAALATKLDAMRGDAPATAADPATPETAAVFSRRHRRGHQQQPLRVLDHS